MPTFNLIDYNNTNEVRECKVNYNGNNIVADELHLTKFQLQTRTIPIHIPHIISDNAVSELHIKNGYSLNGPGFEIQTDEYRALTFNTDWSICAYDMLTHAYINIPVKWQPRHYHSRKPLGVPSRQETLLNPYFHAHNSIHILRCIQIALNEISAHFLVPGMLRISKNGNQYQLLKRKQLATEGQINLKIFFNYELSKSFYFDYTTTWLYDKNGTDNHHYCEVKFDVANLDTRYFEEESREYYVTQTLALTSTLYPFRSIQFIANNIAIDPINEVITSRSTEIPSKSSCILSYNLNVTDIDNIVDNYNYNTSSVLLPCIINTGLIKEFTINCVLKTFDNYTFTVMLDKYDSLSIDCNFKSSQ